MDIIKKFLLLGIFATSSPFVEGHPAYIHSSEEGYYIQIEPEQTLAEVEEEIKQRFPASEGIFLEIAFNSKPLQSSPGFKYIPGEPRNYYAVLTAQEFDDIQHIVTFLGSRPSVISLGWHSGDLEARGDRIRHIHPLTWLLNVFRNEKLKVSFRNIRGTGFVWNKFIGGIKESLDAESDVHNMQPHSEDFSKKLEINNHQVKTLIVARNWDQLFELLMAIPRKGDYEKFGD